MIKTLENDDCIFHILKAIALLPGLDQYVSFTMAHLRALRSEQ